MPVVVMHAADAISDRYVVYLIVQKLMEQQIGGIKRKLRREAAQAKEERPLAAANLRSGGRGDKVLFRRNIRSRARVRRKKRRLRETFSIA